MKKFLVLFASVLFLSCASDSRIPGYIYYRLNANPTTLDPALIVDVAGGSIAAKLFNGLVRLKDDLTVCPDIAERWQVSKDGLRYTFYLKKGVKFPSGKEVRAQDFVYSFERVLEPSTKSPNTWVLDKIAGAKEFMRGQKDHLSGLRALDDYTLEIKLERPFSPFLYLLTMTAAYVVPEETVKSLGQDFSSNPEGTGPFALKEWLPNRQLVLEAKRDYFSRGAKAKGIVYRIIPEDLTALAEFEVGNLDAITIPASAYSRYRNSPKWNRMIVSIEGINTYYLGLNCSRPPFDNPELRRAVAMAIDRQKILKTVYEGRGRPASGPVPDILRKWPAPQSITYDLSQARKIIKRLNPPALNFYITADQEVVDIAEVIQAYLAQAGLKVNIRQLEWSAYKEAINNAEPDMFWLSWWADYPEPENFLFPLFHSSNHGPAGNRVRYTNSTVDLLIEKGQTATEPALSAEYYQRAEQIIAEEAPWVFFWHRTDYALIQPWLRGFRLYPVYSMDKGTEVFLQP